MKILTLQLGLNTLLIACVNGLPSPNDPVTSIPDGVWHGYTYPNGTMVMTDYSTRTKHITVHPRADLNPLESRGKLEKRLVSCWGTPLNHQGTDYAAQNLRNLGARGGTPGGIDIYTFQQTGWVTCVSEGVQVYYCVNAPYSHGNANLDDVNYALSQMDGSCVTYTSSYYQWGDGPEIVGKALASTSICTDGGNDPGDNPPGGVPPCNPC